MTEKTPARNAKAVSTNDTKKSGDPKKSMTISFDYIKSNQFRVVHVDGVHGGVSPNGRSLQMSIFSERSPIPKREEYKLDAGRLGERIAKEERDAIIREVEVELLVSMDVAKRIVKWMEEKIKQLESIQEELPRP